MLTIPGHSYKRQNDPPHRHYVIGRFVAKRKGRADVLFELITNRTGKSWWAMGVHLDENTGRPSGRATDTLHTTSKAKGAAWEEDFARKAVKIEGWP